MRKKVNYYKIGALILMMVELGIAIFIDKEAVRADLNTWRLYVACILFIPVNIVFICTKQTRRVKKHA